jgi:hypothetical protein
MSTSGIAPPGSSGRGAALDYTSRFLGGLVLEQESFPVISFTATPIVGNNPDRVGLLLMNSGGVPVFIGLGSSLSTVQGQFLTPNGGALSLTVTDDFTLPSRAWFGIVTSGSTQLYVLEIIRILQPSQVSPL